MGLYDSFKLNNSTATPTYGGSLIPEVKNIRENLEKSYMTGLEMEDTTRSLLATTAVSELDKNEYDKYLADVDARLSAITKDGDYQNKNLEIYKLAKDVKQRTAAYEANYKKELGASAELKNYKGAASDVQIVLNAARKSSTPLTFDDNGRQVGGYKQGMSLKDPIDVNEKIRKQIVALNPEINSDNLKQANGQWVIEENGSTTEVGKDRIQAAFAALMELDGEFRGQFEQDVALRSLAASDGVTEEDVIGYASTEDGNNIDFKKDILDAASRGMSVLDVYKDKIRKEAGSDWAKAAAGYADAIPGNDRSYTTSKSLGPTALAIEKDNAIDKPREARALEAEIAKEGRAAFAKAREAFASGNEFVTFTPSTLQDGSAPKDYDAFLEERDAVKAEKNAQTPYLFKYGTINKDQKFVRNSTPIPDTEVGEFNSRLQTFEQSQRKLTDLDKQQNYLSQKAENKILGGETISKVVGDIERIDNRMVELQKGNWAANPEYGTLQTERIAAKKKREDWYKAVKADYKENMSTFNTGDNTFSVGGKKAKEMFEVIEGSVNGNNGTFKVYPYGKTNLGQEISETERSTDNFKLYNTFTALGDGTIKLGAYIPQGTTAKQREENAALGKVKKYEIIVPKDSPIATQLMEYVATNSTDPNMRALAVASLPNSAANLAGHTRAPGVERGVGNVMTNGKYPMVIMDSPYANQGTYMLKYYDPATGDYVRLEDDKGIPIMYSSPKAAQIAAETILKQTK